MFKRIFAWILLVGFVLLLVNLIFFRYYWQVSLATYLTAAIYFVFTNKKQV
jgi:hypothetical protein